MNTQQLHKRLNQSQVITIFENYLSQEIDLGQALEYLTIKQSQFYALLKNYQENPDTFSLAYQRTKPTRAISAKAEKLILQELVSDKKLIDNKSMPVYGYNYSSIRDTLLKDHQESISVPTIIKRAKDNGYYLDKKIKKLHDREVLTHLIGELVQHDASHHLWSPYMDKKLCLITSLDDHSRRFLFADFFERESTWAHIQAVKSVFLTHGCPLKYYVDQHSVFRYVKNRDKQSPWNHYTKFTDDVDPQWKQIMQECGVGVTYALSPQAKGKVERPYRWLQERIVRVAAKQKITTIEELRVVLQDLIEQYNNVWVHSTIKQIPVIKYETAFGDGRCLFKDFKLPSPYKDLDDVFCLKAQRRIDSYRKISLEGNQIQVPQGRPHELVDLKLVPDYQNNIVKVRFWQGPRFLGSQNLPLQGFKTLVRF